MAVQDTDPVFVARGKEISEIAKNTPAQPIPTRRNFRNIANQRFTSLVAIEYVGFSGRIAKWKCVCDCGNYCLMTSNALLSGRSMCAVCARAKFRAGQVEYNKEREVQRLPNLYAGSREKPCSTCKLLKPLDAFSMRRKEPDGLMRSCRECVKKGREDWTQANIDHVRAENKTASQRYHNRHPERRAEAMMRCKYGIGYTEYNTLMKEQNGVCAVCGAPPFLSPHTDRILLHIDHDHTTGDVRGLLCQKCNHGIGFFADNPDIMEKAITYLQNSPKRQEEIKRMFLGIQQPLFANLEQETVT